MVRLDRALASSITTRSLSADVWPQFATICYVVAVVMTCIVGSHCLQIIAGVALMMQSYLVTEDDNIRLNGNKEVFEWLVTVLDCATQGKRWRGYGFAVIEVIEVKRVTVTLALRLTCCTGRRRRFRTDS